MFFLKILFWLSLFIIFYAYLGYPLLIALLAIIYKKRNIYVESFPSVTFIIPAYNEETYISRKLDNTLLIDYPHEKLQILVVADGSTDQTPEIVRVYKEKGIELSYIPDRNGKMAAIIRAMQFAKGEIVVFSDANNMYDIHAIRELILPFSDPTVGGTTGAKLILEDGRDLSSAEGLYWKYESFIKIQESKIDSCVSSVGEILAIRRDLFNPPTEKVINDDHYLILDLLCRGHKVIYTPRARSYEYVSETATDEVERRTRMNAGLYQTMFMSNKLLPLNRPLIAWQLISHKYFRALVPFALMLLLISNSLLLIFNFETASFLTRNVFILSLWLQVIFYILALIGNKININSRIGKIFYLPTFLLNSNIATFMGFYKFITNKQTHLWKRVRR